MNTRRGTTLIETVLATGLLLTSMTLLVQFAVQGATQTTTSHRQTQAALLAQQQMEELLAHRNDLTQWQNHVQENHPADRKADRRRFSEDKWNNHRWTYSLAPDGNHSNMTLATITVYWRLARNDAFNGEYQLSSLLACPPPRNPGENDE